MKTVCFILVVSALLMLSPAAGFGQTRGVPEQEAGGVELQRLERLAADPKQDAAQVWDGLIALRQRFPGSRHSVIAGQILSQVRSPLDRLDPKDIPASERMTWQPGGLVCVLGEHGSRHWKSVVSRGWNHITGLAVSSDGKLIASRGNKEGVRLWEVETMRLKAWLNPAWAPALSPDGKMLAVAEYLDRSVGTSIIRLYDVSGPKLVERLALRKEGHHCSSITFAPGGKGLAVMYHEVFDINKEFNPLDKGYVFWDWSRGKPEQQDLPRVRGVEDGGVFTADGKLFVHRESGGELHLWGIDKEGQKLHTILHKVRQFALSPDGKCLATLTAGDPSMRIWEVRGGQPKELAVFGESDWTLTRAALTPFFSHDGRLIGILNKSSLQVWDMAEIRRRVQRKEAAAPPRVVPLPFRTSKLCFCPDGKIVFGGPDGAIRLWDLDKGRELFPLHGHCGDVWALDFSPDGRMLATGGTDGTLRLWDLTDPKPREQFVHKHKEQDTHLLRFSPQGNTLASVDAAGAYWRPNVRLWDLRDTGLHERAVTRLPDSFLLDRPVLLFDPRGTHLILTGKTRKEEDEVKLWTAAVMMWPLGGQAGLKNEKHYLFGNAEAKDVEGMTWGAAFSPDGRRLALLTGQELRLLDWRTPVLKDLDKLQPHHLTEGLAFSPDATELVTSGADHLDDRQVEADVYRVRLWTVAGDRLKERASFVSKRAKRVEFALGGECLLTEEEEGACVLRDKLTGKVRWRWQPPAGTTTFALAPDGRHVALGNANGTVYIVRLKEAGQR